jgi:hypothetical protein
MVMMMTMPEHAVANMTAAKAAVSVPAMSTVTVTSRESLARDGQRRGAQREGSDRGGNDLLELRHGRLFGWAELGSLCDDPPLKAGIAVRCDQDHATAGHRIGGITELVGLGE